MKRLRIGKTRQALVDDADIKRLREFTWHYSKGYALRQVTTEAGDKSTISLQREVMGLAFGDGLEVRCMDGDKMNCQKDNLVVRKRTVREK